MLNFNFGERNPPCVVSTQTRTSEMGPGDSRTWLPTSSPPIYRSVPFCGALFFWFGNLQTDCATCVVPVCLVLLVTVSAAPRRSLVRITVRAQRGLGRALGKASSARSHPRGGPRCGRNIDAHFDRDWSPCALRLVFSCILVSRAMTKVQHA